MLVKFIWKEFYDKITPTFTQFGQLQNHFYCSSRRRPGAEARHGGVHRGRPDHPRPPRPLPRTSASVARLAVARPLRVAGILTKAPMPIDSSHSQPRSELP